jgi:hypothetical protein
MNSQRTSVPKALGAVLVVGYIISISHSNYELRKTIKTMDKSYTDAMVLTYQHGCFLLSKSQQQSKFCVDMSYVFESALRALNEEGLNNE